MSEVSNREATSSLLTVLVTAVGPRFPIAQVIFFEIVGILESWKPELHGQAAVEPTSEAL
jgi:hypothetical protein